MNTFETTTTSAPPPRRSLPMQAMALATVTSFLSMVIGCDSRAPDAVRLEGDIVVRASVLIDGAHQEVLTESLPFSELPAWDRTIIVDGIPTTDLATLRGAAVVQIPLNTGGTLTLNAVGGGDVFAISGYQPRAGEPLLTTLRLGDTSVAYHINGADWTTQLADVVVTMEGSTEQTLVATERVAMLSLLASVEDQPQIGWLAVVAILGGAWLAICGAGLAHCAYSCTGCKGYKFQCFGFTLESNDGDWSVNVGGVAGCECIDPCRES